MSEYYTYELCYITRTEWTTEFISYGEGLDMECITLESF